MSQTSSLAVAEWLRSRVGEPITARSTWSTGGRIYPSDENVTVVPLPTPEVKPGGFAATCQASVTIDGEPLEGEVAVRAEILDSRESLAKRAVAMGMAQMASEDRTAAKVLPTPWHTAQVKVTAHDLGWGNDGDETIALDIMQWAAPFDTAFEGIPEQGRAERAIELAIPLFSGLDHIYRHSGRVHRDIHHHNVMFVDKHLVFIDWGISSVVTAGTSTNTRAAGKWQSSYMAPEARAGQKVGAYTDVWALGVLLCRMACGQDPTLVNSNTGEIELPAGAMKLPDWLREVIGCLTEFDRNDRMKLTDAVAAMIDAGRNSVPGRARRESTTSSNTTVAPTTTTMPGETSLLTATESDAPAELLASVQELLAEGYAHSEAGHVKATLAAYAGAAEICEGAPEPVLRQHLAMALNNAQWELYQSGQHSEALATCSRLIDTFGHDPDLVLRQQVAIALNSGAYAKREFGLAENAVGDWEEVVDKFGSDPDLVLRRQVAMALRDKGLALVELDRRVDALSAFTRLIESFERDPDLALRQQVAMALNNKRSYLYQLGHHAEAAAACTRLAETFGSDRDPVVRQQVIVALLSKGLILERSGQQEGALAAYGRLIDIFAEDSDPTVQRSVAWARERLRNR